MAIICCEQLVAEWSQKFLKKFGMSGIYGKIIPNMDTTE